MYSIIAILAMYSIIAILATYVQYNSYACYATYVQNLLSVYSSVMIDQTYKIINTTE